jgi:hypothetical protein
MIRQIKNIKEKVKALLIRYPHLRDSDVKLVSNIWHSQIGAGKAKEISGFDFLASFANGNFINPESIRRIRQKIQEQNVELRGKSYKARKAHAKEMKKQIHTL